ncbi:MAG: HAD family hydrolase [Gammaproteobacteria bacterium]
MQALLFDLGNVLVRYSGERRMRQLGEVTGLGPTAAALLLSEDDWHLRYESGALSTAAFAARLVEAAARPCTAAEVMQAFTDVFAPMPEMAELLRGLRARQYRLIVVSNTNPTDIESVRRLDPPLLDTFDQLVLSYAVGANKPEPAFYAAALAAAAVPPSACVFIDDLRPNIDGARRAGMHGVVFTSAAECRAELTQLLGHDV